MIELRKHLLPGLLPGILALAPPSLSSLPAQDTPSGQQKPTAKAPLPEDRRKGAESVKESDLREWLGYLAGPECEGRGTGQEGYRVAAEYMRDHFKSLGLKPGAGDDYFQVVPWTRTQIQSEEQGLTLSAGNETLSLSIEKGLRGWASAEFEFSGPLTIITTDEPTTWEPEAGSLDGRAVVVVTEASLTTFTRRGRTMTNPRFLLSNLQRIRGRVSAAGGRLVALASDKAYGDADTWSPTTRAATGRGRRGAQPVVPVMNMEHLKLVTDFADAKLPGLEGFARTDVNVDVDAKIELKEEQAPAFNVCAILEGSDPKLKDEFVVIGSHLDHLGKRGDTIYYGADDDGRGSTGLMAVSKAFAKNPVKPRRSILFLAFCGEENGLIGSRFYSDNPSVPLDKMVAELQMDMIGRNESGRQAGNETEDQNLNCLHLVGTEKLSRDLHKLCLRLNQDRADFAIEYDEEDVYSRSDHYNFARFGVPIAFFFTGFHPQYHQPDDTPEKIDYQKLGRVAMYVYDIGFELAQQDDRPLIDPDLWKKMGRLKASQEPAAPFRK